jgi:hypothetical protein
MVWGKNIFNKYYWTTVIASTDTAPAWREAGHLWRNGRLQDSLT